MVDSWVTQHGTPDLDQYRKLLRDDQIQAISALTRLRAEVSSPLDSHSVAVWAASAAILALLIAASGPLLPAPWTQFLLVPVPFLVVFVIAATLVVDRRLAVNRARLSCIEGRLVEFERHLEAPSRGAGLMVASLGRIRLPLRLREV